MKRGRATDAGMVEVEILADFLGGPRGKTPYLKSQAPNPVVSLDDADLWEAKSLARRIGTATDQT